MKIRKRVSGAFFVCLAKSRAFGDFLRSPCFVPPALGIRPVAAS